jgi:hypothetical protein
MAENKKPLTIPELDATRIALYEARMLHAKRSFDEMKAAKETIMAKYGLSTVPCQIVADAGEYPVGTVLGSDGKPLMVTVDDSPAAAEKN